MPGGDLVIADSANNAVRLVNVLTHQIQTVAGNGTAGYNADGIAATAERIASAGHELASTSSLKTSRSISQSHKSTAWA